MLGRIFIRLLEQSELVIIDPRIGAKRQIEEIARLGEKITAAANRALRTIFDAVASG